MCFRIETRADLDFQFIEPAGNDSAQTGTPVSSGKSLSSVKIVGNIDKLNINGGSISIGHPFGMTGSRMVGTIANEMLRRKARYGVVTMCVGGGQGAAALFERA